MCETFSACADFGNARFCLPIVGVCGGVLGELETGSCCFAECGD